MSRFRGPVRGTSNPSSVYKVPSRCVQHTPPLTDQEIRDDALVRRTDRTITMAAGLIDRFSSRVTAAPLGTDSRCSEDPLYCMAGHSNKMKVIR